MDGASRDEHAVRTTVLVGKLKYTLLSLSSMRNIWGFTKYLLNLILIWTHLKYFSTINIIGATALSEELKDRDCIGNSRVQQRLQTYLLVA